MDILNVPKPDRKIVSAQKLFEKVKVLMQLDPSEGIAIQWSYQTEGVALFIDEKQLTQVLINLVKNAIHSLENQDSGLIEVVAGVNSDDRKYITVKDNGPGIPKEMIDEIFVPFFTTKEKGTGIGLSLSRQIMQLHGGSLKLFSEPNVATVFTLTF